MEKLEKLTIKDVAFVAIQMLLFLIYVLPFEIISFNISDWLRYSSLIIVIFGLLIGLIALLQINTKISPFPRPVADSQLIVNGVFAISRHPIYTSILAVTFGYALYSTSLFKVLIFILLWLLFYYKSLYEEQLLSSRFTAYIDYKKKTRRFI